MIAAPISQTQIHNGPSKNGYEFLMTPRISTKRNNSVQVTSLQDLISKLYAEFEKDRVDIDYICDIMTAYKSVPQEWKKYAKFDRHRYTRNLIDSGNGKFNLMILCWGEGHGSAIHDHADAHCFMKVIDGTLSEVRFEFPSDGELDKNGSRKLKEIGRTELKTNEVCYINDSLGLHRVENPSHVSKAVSLHLYCPPFDACSVFNQQTGQRMKCPVTFWSKYGERDIKKFNELLSEMGGRINNNSTLKVPGTHERQPEDN